MGPMKVTVSFMGPLREYAGQQKVEFSFPGQASFGAVLDEIGRRFGHSLPGRIWDPAERVFKSGILIMGTGRDLNDRETLLEDGEEIKVLPMLGGG